VASASTISSSTESILREAVASEVELGALSRGPMSASAGVPLGNARTTRISSLVLAERDCSRGPGSGVHSRSEEKSSNVFLLWGEGLYVTM
jgi:hypothetical protein